MTFPMEDQYVPEEFQDELDEDILGPPDPVSTAGASRRAMHYRRQIMAYERVLIANRRTLEASRTPEGIARMRATVKRVEGQLAAARRGLERAREEIEAEPVPWGDRLTGEDRDAYEALSSLFESYGLGSLAETIYDYVVEGYGADTIALLLQDTKEYKERFAANEERRKRGLAVLAPGEYLQVEAAYRQILENAGMPRGFYDSPADFRQWIGSDVSPTEIKGRVDLAVAATTQANPAYREALMEMYGIGQNELVAYFLDRKKAEPILKKQAAAAAVGAAALRRGLRVDRGRMEDLAASGVSGEEADKVYGEIERGLSSMLGIASRFGQGWGLSDMEAYGFGLGKETEGKWLASQERAMFAGSRGSSASGLSAGYRQT